jgi:hypothetical protein
LLTSLPIVRVVLMRSAWPGRGDRVSILQRFERFRKDLPAVDDDRLTSDIARLLRGEEQRGVTDVLDVPSRFSGIEAAMVLWYSGPSDSSPSVMMLPGMSALTVIQYFASSIAAVRRKPSKVGRNVPAGTLSSG